METETTSNSSSFEWRNGILSRVRTSFGEVIEGHVYCFDDATNCVVLQCTSSQNPTSKKSYRVLNTAFIQDTEILSHSPLEMRPPGLVDMNKVRAKEEAAIHEAKQEAKRIGVGVSADAQRIFNALSKTLPCHWKQDTIVVFEDLLIRNPYRVEDVTGGAQTSKSELARVKRVLSGEIKRLGL